MKNLWEWLFGRKKKNEEKKMDNDDRVHAARCFIEYRYIPIIIECISAGKMLIKELLEVEHWRRYITERIKKDFDFEWDEFSITELPVYNECRIIIYKFPKPNRMPQAKYGAVIIDYKLNGINYYTLEYSIDNCWILGGQDIERHYNFGEAKSEELDDFILWLKKDIQRKREAFK